MGILNPIGVRPRRSADEADDTDDVDGGAIAGAFFEGVLGGLSAGSSGSRTGSGYVGSGGGSTGGSSTSSGGGRCPGAQIATDANCRPIH